MNDKTITISLEDAKNLILLINDGYSESLRHSPRHFIAKSKGKAQVYYKLLEEYFRVSKEEDQK